MRPPTPPFTEETARQKVQAAEDAWNTRDPERVAAAYTEDSQWRNRHEFFSGRPAIVEFLTHKWARELDYALRKDLWAFTENPHRGPLPVREPRRRRPVVAQLRQRAVGVRRRGLHAPPGGEHQRRGDQRGRAPDLRRAPGVRARDSATARLSRRGAP